jgi:hypothetical protein
LSISIGSSQSLFLLQRKTVYTILFTPSAWGGNAGARLAERLSLPTSATLLLRRLRQFTIPSSGNPRVVGIDDWAYKRGQKYGTMVVDLEQHRVIDLLPDRTTDTVATWLKNQPTIEILSRDRARCLRRGGSPGSAAGPASGGSLAFAAEPDRSGAGGGRTA